MKNYINYIKSLPGGTWFSKDKTIYYVSLILLVVVIFLSRGCNDKPIPDKIITKTVYVKVPGKAGHIDNKKTPKPIPQKELVIDKEYMARYNKLKDSVAKAKLYTEAITINDYKQNFEDSIQKVTVNSKVRGTLLNQDIDYFVKPTTIKTTKTTIIKTNPPKIHILAGISVGVPVDLLNTRTIVEGDLYLQNKKQNILQLGIDSEKRIKIGYIIKL